MFRDRLPIPNHFDPAKVDKVWRVEYQTRANEAQAWAASHSIRPALEDEQKIGLLLVDVQNTFCLPDFELYVAGRSGTGAVDDNRRLCQFIYRHLHRITEIVLTMDTHQAMQIFHPLFLVNDKGEHPAPLTQVSVKDVEQGKWRFNPALQRSLGLPPEAGQRHLEHYVRELKKGGRYDLTVWPYHAMLGGIGHALVSAVEEAIFFHTLARHVQPSIHTKGRHALTENYSVFAPEISEDAGGRPIGRKNVELLQKLLSFDAVIVAGQAKSHCVAWTIADLLRELPSDDAKLAEKFFLLEDCTSPVVIPDVVDFTEQADAAFARFAEAGMHRVRSSEAFLES